ncbi:MAG: type II restriction endonuclease [Bacteroidaceae bacterium]|nr:type II restriction endonuclease [Bacteroidaceae bacterium]
MKDFNLFISQLTETNATLGSFTDFEKVSRNVSRISIKLNQLNYLLGKNDLKTAVSELFEENPKSFEVLDILVAVRSSENKKVLNENYRPVLVKSYFTDIDSICIFIEDTGLADVFASSKITNLVDYVFGIEVGLDTNARKNRGGNIMAGAVAKVFVDAGIKFRTEVNSTEFPEITALGADLKRFDFVVETRDKTYLIETNYYNSGGSKLNEVARAYSELAPKINQYASFEFVWITDGQGWHFAKNKLEEAYRIIPRVYNLTSISNFIDELII